MRQEVAESPVRIKLWDLPMRIYHWSLMISVATAIVTAEIGGDMMKLHGQAGLAIIGLLAFRLVWGLVGSTHARFWTFFPSLSRLQTYLKGQWRGVGHNPLGALSVFTLLALLAAQAVTGLFSNDDIAFNGPLFELIEKTTSDRLTGWHHQLANVLFVLIALHVAAILFYVWYKKNNLVKPMITGWKEISPEHQIEKQPSKGNIFGLAASILVAFLAVYGASSAGLANGADAPVAAKKVESPPSW